MLPRRGTHRASRLVGLVPPPRLCTRGLSYAVHVHDMYETPTASLLSFLLTYLLTPAHDRPSEYMYTHGRINDKSMNMHAQKQGTSYESCLISSGMAEAYLSK